MAERKESSLQGRELSGILLFTLSAFPVVLVGWALFQGEAPVGRGTARFAQTLIDAAGYLPVLLCAGGFATVGAALLLSSRELDLGRHLSGFLFAGVGLAVILGAFHDQPVGVLHGGGLGAATGGLLRSGIGAWSGALIGGAVLFVSVWLAWLGGSLALPARKRASSATLSHALTENDMDGVSVAEATALVPDASTLAYMEQLWRRTSSSSTQAAPLPPSPYPEDVRRLGKVPEGARPLPRPHESTRTHRQDLAAATPGSGAAADVRTDLGPGPHLAGEPALAPAEPRTFRRSADQDPFGRDSEALTLTAEEARVVAGAPRVPEPPAVPHIPEGARLLETRPAPGLGGGPPVPTWEAATSGEAAAGAPAFVRREWSVEEGLHVDREEAELELPFDAVVPGGARAEYGDSEDDYDDEDEEDEEDDDEDDIDDEEEEEEEEDDEFDEDEEDAAHAPPVRARAGSPAQPPSPVEPEVVLQPYAARDPRTVVREGDESPDGREQLLQDAGILFLEQGRVAVSLLQRRFGLEFDEACEVLDELQELGLIGPYKGGQQRDILLSLEEWQSRVAAT